MWNLVDGNNGERDEFTNSNEDKAKIHVQLRTCRKFTYSNLLLFQIQYQTEPERTRIEMLFDYIIIVYKINSTKTTERDKEES